MDYSIYCMWRMYSILLLNPKFQKPFIKRKILSVVSMSAIQIVLFIIISRVYSVPQR